MNLEILTHTKIFTGNWTSVRLHTRYQEWKNMTVFLLSRNLKL